MWNILGTHIKIGGVYGHYQYSSYIVLSVINILFNSAINCISTLAMDPKTPRPDEKQESKIVGDVLCYQGFIQWGGGGGGDRGEASPPNSLASPPPKNLTLIKLSIIISQ